MLIMRHQTMFPLKINVAVPKNILLIYYVLYLASYDAGQATAYEVTQPSEGFLIKIHFK